MEIQSVATGATSVPAAARSDLGKDAFLQLLVTQLRYQDPLSPMENEAFLAQLAQFSSLEQMQQLNETVESSNLLAQSLNNSAAAGFIGRHVRAAGSEAILGAEGNASLGYVLAQPADRVTVTVFDETGAVVRVLEQQGVDGGSGSVEWDGHNTAGERVAEGTYRFEVDAIDAEENAVAASTWIEGRVDGVTYRGGSAFLLVGDREVPLSSVLDIFVPGTEE